MELVVGLEPATCALRIPRARVKKCRFSLIFCGNVRRH